MLCSTFSSPLSSVFPALISLGRGWWASTSHGVSAMSCGVMVAWCSFQKLKEAADKIQEEYGYCILDGHREKIGNFKTEPPGLFRGRGDHPKMGMLKKRIMPEDVIINCSK